jgi:mRNA interferase YafQ
MREIVRKGQFKKDYQRIQRTGRKVERIFEAIELLQAEHPLPPHYRDHQLSGNWKDYRECHLGGDWLLIYQLTTELLILVRTGSHSELFE